MYLKNLLRSKDREEVLLSMGLCEREIFRRILTNGTTKVEYKL